VQTGGGDVHERPEGATLDRLPKPVEVSEVRLVELADEHAPVKLVYEEALVGKQPKRLAQSIS